MYCLGNSFFQVGVLQQKMGISIAQCRYVIIAGVTVIENKPRQPFPISAWIIYLSADTVEHKQVIKIAANGNIHKTVQ